MAAGTSSRFAPLSYERHKGLTVVKGEVLIERQIEQLQSAGVPRIYVVTGYKADQFEYLRNKYGVELVHNDNYLTRNNNGSLWVVRKVLRNSYLCSVDNYFQKNPFESEVPEAYYAAEYADGQTAEWCMTEDEDGYVDSVTKGGSDAWYMMGHAFFSEEFSRTFVVILEDEYDLPETRDKLWEDLYLEHLDVLKMRIRKYDPDVIFEFDTMDELRLFDETYIDDTRSKLLKNVAAQLGVAERDITNIETMKGDDAEAIGFTFACKESQYSYLYDTGELSVCSSE